MRTGTDIDSLVAAGEDAFANRLKFHAVPVLYYVGTFVDVRRYAYLGSLLRIISGPCLKIVSPKSGLLHSRLSFGSLLLTLP